jgi:formylglycine-generating enzyme required for sulfatase activity
LPERSVFVSSFLMDRYEVTVARYRKAFADGLNSNPPHNDTMNCTWGNPPDGKEEYPANCVTYLQARAFCQFEGGDLPTEAQWEYAANTAGRDGRTHFPYGNGDGRPPDCANVVYGRASGLGCGGLPTGPAAVTAADHPGGDVTPGPGAGIVDLAGNVAESMLDVYAAYSANCWLGATLADPVCLPTALVDPATTQRGSSFGTDSTRNLLSTIRAQAPAHNSTEDAGFRCVRKGTSP